MSKRPGQAPIAQLPDAQTHPRSAASLLVLGLVALVLFAGFVALGTWQLHRLQWKRALIERVEQRVHAAPVPAPGPDRWAQINAQSDEYRRVSLSGTFLYGFTTRVQAATELGSGFWLLTPLQTDDGSLVLINRGFVAPDGHPQDAKSHSLPTRADRQVSVTGLLRMSEPGGAFLRRNDPSSNRWYSRDVQGIAAARGLGHVAPYFVDADADGGNADAEDRPVGGLTVIAFPNNHLVYALTWYALALMVAGAAWWIGREEGKSRARRDQARAG